MAAKKEEKKPAKKEEKKAAAPAKAEGKKSKAEFRDVNTIFEEMVPMLTELQVESGKLVKSNNASAGRRARQLTLKLQPLFKEFRASSVDFSKKNLD